MLDVGAGDGGYRAITIHTQGFHDVCSVLVLVMGSAVEAAPLASRLASSYFREVCVERKRERERERERERMCVCVYTYTVWPPSTSARRLASSYFREVCVCVWCVREKEKHEVSE